MSVPAISRSLSDNPENLATSVRFLAAVALVFITICSYGLFCATHRGAWIDFLAATLALIAILAVAAVYLVLRFGVSMMAAKMAFQGILSARPGADGSRGKAGCGHDGCRTRRR
jgi:hypothetical protein